jgi:hypothetical protein
MERFIIQPSEKPNHWVCTDTDNLIVCVFEEHKFNETQEFDYIGDKLTFNANNLARFAREMGDWLRENYYNKVF